MVVRDGDSGGGGTSLRSSRLMSPRSSSGSTPLTLQGARSMLCVRIYLRFERLETSRFSARGATTLKAKHSINQAAEWFGFGNANTQSHILSRVIILHVSGSVPASKLAT